jgi:hypothetical protein
MAIINSFTSDIIFFGEFPLAIPIEISKYNAQRVDSTSGLVFNYNDAVVDTVSSTDSTDSTTTSSQANTTLYKDISRENNLTIRFSDDSTKPNFLPILVATLGSLGSYQTPISSVTFNNSFLSSDSLRIKFEKARDLIIEKSCKISFFSSNNLFINNFINNLEIFDDKGGFSQGTIRLSSASKSESANKKATNVSLISTSTSGVA